MKKVLFSVMLLCACLVCCKSSAPEKQASVQNGEAEQRVTNAAAEQVLDSATPSTKRPGDESLQNVLDAIKKIGLPKYRNFELKESLAVDINNNGDTIYILLLAKEGADGVLLVCKYTEEVLTIIDENDAILDKNEIENGNHSLWDDDKSTFYLRSEYGANGGTGDEGYFTVNSKGVFVDSLILYHRPILFDELSGIDAYIKRASISQKDFGTLRLKDLKADIWDHHKIEFRIQEKDNLPSLKEIFEKISKNSKKDKYYLKSFAGGDKDIERYRSYLEIHPLSDQNHTMYNDIGYYLEQAGAYEEAIYVLSAVLEKYPQRVVAYLNIADAYWGNGDKAKAKDVYEKYASLMTAQGKDTGKIPKRVYDRVSIGEDSEKEHFVVESDWKGVKCKKYHLDYGAPVQECVFPNANLLQVYSIVKRIDENLKAELPVKNFKYSPPTKETGFIGVEYQYKSEKHLLIESSYDGGSTDIEIVEDKFSTRSKITYSD